MAAVTGLLTDLALDPLSGRFPRLFFRTDKPATTGPNLIVTARVEATVNAATGAFSVDVVPTDALVPATTYTITADWDAGQELDVLTGLRVPSAGGTILDLIVESGRATGGLVMYGYGPPPPTLSNVLYVDVSGVNPTLYGPSTGGI